MWKDCFSSHPALMVVTSTCPKCMSGSTCTKSSSSSPSPSPSSSSSSSSPAASLRQTNEKKNEGCFRCTRPPSLWEGDRREDRRMWDPSMDKYGRSVTRGSVNGEGAIFVLYSSSPMTMYLMIVHSSVANDTPGVCAHRSLSVVNIFMGSSPRLGKLGTSGRVGRETEGASA
jgi:hypothetical protein